MMERLFRTHPPALPDHLVDVHVNVGVSDVPGLSYGRLEREAARRVLVASGITTACVFPPLMRQAGKANRALAGWAEQTPLPTLLPFARLGGPRPVPVRTAWQARRALRAGLARIAGRGAAPEEPDFARYAGIKLIPHLSGVPSEATLEAISARELPVLVHAGRHVPPGWIERHLLPRLRGPLILAHLGAYPAYLEGLGDALDLARRVERVWLDTSGVALAAFLQEAVRQAPEKLLFGSDAPLVHPRTAWYQTALAVRDDALLERIAYRNAADVFGEAVLVRRAAEHPAPRP